MISILPLIISSTLLQPLAVREHALYPVSASPGDSLLLIVDFYENYGFISAAYGEIQFLLGGCGGETVGEPQGSHIWKTFKGGTPSLQIPVMCCNIIRKIIIFIAQQFNCFYQQLMVLVQN